MLADALSDETYTHPTFGTGLTAINIDTARNTLIVCGLLVLAGVITRFRLGRDKPGGLQNVLEFIVEFVNGLISDTLGRRPIRLAPIAITLFTFILLANLLGLVPTLKSPTNDVNTALALALFAVGLLHFQSVRFRGVGGYVAHYFSVITPRWSNPLGAIARILFGLLEILQEIAKPFTLSFRLYFNIFVGELMLALIVWGLSFVAPLAGAVWVLFSVFVGCVQAFIFTMLTISYIAQSTEVHHDDAAAPQAAGGGH